MALWPLNKKKKKKNHKPQNIIEKSEKVKVKVKVKK